MKKTLGLSALACFAALFTGCASGPKFSTVKASLPPLAAENGRIFFYRTTTLGAAVQPDVKLDGEKVGSAVAKGAFYADRPAGNHAIDTTTEVKRSLSLVLDKGQTRYVRFGVSFGFFAGHVYPELVDDKTGEKEIAECSYTGPALNAPPTAAGTRAKADPK